ncbi:MAG: ABC transporter ATP-binding protein [Spirochaetaceae bacterium]
MNENIASNPVPPVMSIHDLDCHYKGKQVLHGVSASFPPGQITVIAGRSGCGKTTLLRNALRLNEPSKGRIEVFGIDITHMSQEELMSLRPRMGVLFQSGALIQSYTVAENVAVPLEQHTHMPLKLIERVVSRKLELVELAGAEHQMPAELSGGMRKRAALARTLALDPEIVFFDEPSAGLDPVTAAALDELIMSLSRKLNITVVIVTHELTSIKRIGDRMLFLDSGRAIFEGPLDEALRSDLPPIQEFLRLSDPGQHFAESR